MTSNVIKWKTEYRKIADLIDYENNPRQINKDNYKKLVESLKQDGYHARICINKDNTIIGGHQRKKAMLDAGYTPQDEIEVIVPSMLLSEDDLKRINIRDNLPYGEWDFDILANTFNMDDLIDWGMPEDFLPDKIEDEINPQGDEDYLPESPNIPKTVRGDIYEIGKHRLMCGDSTLVDDVDKLMCGEKAEQMITDPPYNVAYEGKTKSKLRIINDQQPDDEFREFLCSAFLSASTVMKPGAAFYIWHADSEGYNFRGACKDVGLTVKQCLIWKKQNMVLGRQDYHWQHEPCLYGWKEGAAHRWEADRKQTTILDFERPSKNIDHPTMKPVELFSYQIGNNTKAGDIVIDIFGGSGTAMVAAQKIKRICYMMELDEKYCDVIVSRMHDLFPDLTIKLNEKEIDWDAS